MTEAENSIPAPGFFQDRKRLKIVLGIAGVVLILLWEVFFACANVHLSGNDSGRFASVQALAEQGTYAIENTVFRTVDHVVRNNHAYYDKLPLISVVLAGVYAPFHHLGGYSFAEDYNTLIFAVNFFYGAAVGIGMFLVFVLALRGENIWGDFVFSIFLVLGSWIGSYLAAVNNHNAAALNAFIFFLLLRKNLPGLAGFAAGLLVNFDIPCAVVFGAAGLFNWGKDRRKILCYIAGGVLGGMILLLCNQLLTGTPIPLYSQSFSPGIANKDQFDYFFNILLGRRGLLLQQPLLLLIFPVIWLDRDIWKNRAEKIILAGCLICVVLYGAITMEYGGWAYGFRYVIPVIPLLWFFIARYFNRFYLFLLPLLLAGTVFAAAGAYSPFCTAYEGWRTQPSSPNYVVRNPFLGNLLCWSYASNPDSWLTRYLSTEVYPEYAVLPFLFESYQNNFNLEMHRKVWMEFERRKQNEVSSGGHSESDGVPVSSPVSSPAREVGGGVGMPSR